MTFDDALRQLAEQPGGTLSIQDQHGSVVAILMSPQVVERLTSAAPWVNTIPPGTRQTRKQRKHRAMVRRANEAEQRNVARLERRLMHERNRARKKGPTRAGPGLLTRYRSDA